MALYQHKKPHPEGDKSDLFELRMTPEKGLGEEDSWWMNVYDMQNIIWLLSDASLKAIESDLPLSPMET